jgi:hypothetical protein
MTALAGEGRRILAVLILALHTYKAIMQVASPSV